MGCIYGQILISRTEEAAAFPALSFRFVQHKLTKHTRLGAEHASEPTQLSGDAYFCRAYTEEACLPDLALLQREDAVQEDQEADQSGREQHARVPAQPGEVEADLLPKVPPETTQTQG